MSQLALFQGPHVPRTAARAALARGQLADASALLARLGAETPEAADAQRLERIHASLAATREALVHAVHTGFASALGSGGSAGFLSESEWFGLYARCVAGALRAQPGTRFRGWMGAQFAWAAADAEAARSAVSRIVEATAPGSAWIEAARLAFDLGEGASARRWIHAACLGSQEDLALEPMPLESCGIPALNAAPQLPRLPAPVEDLFATVRGLAELPGPRSRWVAIVGEIDRVLTPADVDLEDTGESAADHREAARAFLAALRAARRSRERDGPRAPGRCSDRELRARRRMQRIAPTLLERYLHGLGQTLL